MTKTYKIRMDEKFITEFREKTQINNTFKYENETKQKHLSLWNNNFPKYEMSKIKWGYIQINEEQKQNIETTLGLKFIRGSCWYGQKPIYDNSKLNWYSTENIQNQYHIYIISKGRYEKKLTYDSLVEMGCENFSIVIEEDEVDKYIEHNTELSKIIIFTNEEKQKYLDKGQGGSIPVRNFVYEYSKSKGEDKHWIVDDNIKGFYRFYQNQKHKVLSPICFNVLEEFSKEYSNLYLLGMNYNSFCPSIDKKRQLIQMNTRIYSCILIDNNIPLDELWRGMYNEDTDLSLRLLKKGFPTCLFNCFVCNKQTTLSCKGGNTDSIYKENGLELKLQSLIEQHSDVVKETYKFKKIHHEVNYKPFENNKLEKSNYISDKNYSLELKF